MLSYDMAKDLGYLYDDIALKKSFDLEEDSNSEIFNRQVN